MTQQEAITKAKQLWGEDGYAGLMKMGNRYGCRVGCGNEASKGTGFTFEEAFENATPNPSV